MKKILGVMVVLALTALFVTSAEAINISSASVQNGLAAVSGGKAAQNSSISWEGSVVATANKNGGFSFSFGVVPADCVGTLRDGVTTIDVSLSNCTPTPQSVGGVKKTGQTQCFDRQGNLVPCTGTGQDGELQEGMARSYTDNGATITDNVTKLEWEKLKNDGSITDYRTTYTWTTAPQKIAALNAANFAGHNDWRWPNINELISLTDYGRFNPPIDPVFNNNVDSFTPSSGFWSSSTYLWASDLGFTSNAWYVNYSDGKATFVDKGNQDLMVRAVRGGS